MALSSKEQNKIVQLLGYGGKILQAGSVIYNKILNDRLQSLPQDTENILRDYLERVYAIEKIMNCAPTRLSAMSVDDIKLNNNELSDLRKERKKIAREIAAHVDIPYIGVNGSNVTVMQ